jgi:hypothetical protein
MNKAYTIGVYMTVKTKAAVQKRADSVGLSKSNYCKLVIEDHLKSGRKIILLEEDR